MSINDKGIVDTLKESPENGFRMLMTKYQEAVYWHIRRLVVSHDDAQDASQETFVRIYRSLDHYRGDCSLAAGSIVLPPTRLCDSSASGGRKLSLWRRKPQGVALLPADNYIDYG